MRYSPSQEHRGYVSSCQHCEQCSAPGSYGVYFEGDLARATNSFTHHYRPVSPIRWFHSYHYPPPEVSCAQNLSPSVGEPQLNRIHYYRSPGFTQHQERRSIDRTGQNVPEETFDPDNFPQLYSAPIGTNLNTRVLHTTPKRETTTPHDNGTVVPKEIAFNAAARRLSLILVKAARLLDLFLRTFKQEMSARYMNRRDEWRRKVSQYENDLVLPVLHEADGSGSSDVDNADNLIERATFRELQTQIEKSLNTFLISTIQTPMKTIASPIKRTVDELLLPNEDDINMDVQHEIAQALHKSVKKLRPQLEEDVKHMANDHLAARQALLNIRTLKCLFEQYRRGWHDSDEVVEES